MIFRWPSLGWAKAKLPARAKPANAEIADRITAPPTTRSWGNRYSMQAVLAPTAAIHSCTAPDSVIRRGRLNVKRPEPMWCRLDQSSTIVNPILPISLSFLRPLARGSISSPIPRGSIAWVRARRASLALVPQLPRQNKSSTGAHVHREPAQASSVLSPGFDSSIGHPLQLVEPFSKILTLASLHQGDGVVMTAHGGKLIAYSRVSTDKQGKSVLGLVAERQAVETYLNGGSWTLVAEFVEVESGKHSDRPQLAAALGACKKHRAKLVIAKLDRLFAESGVHCDADGFRSRVRSRR